MFQYQYSAYDLDYDPEALIAQCANPFGPDDKGLFDDHYYPLLQSEDSGSLYPSSTSRASSIAADSSRRERSSTGPIIPPGPPLSTIMMEGYERARCMDTSPLVHTQHPALQSGNKPLKIPSDPDARQSKTRTTTRPPKRQASLTPEPSTSRKRARKTYPPSSDHSDEEDDESNSDTDDEYVPAPPRPSSRRRRRPLYIRHPASPAHLSSTPPIKCPPGTSLSRNKQATSNTAIIKACDISSLNCICPVCGWNQDNGRVPDFKRHLRTHMRPDSSDQTRGWWCKGVLLSESHKHNIPQGAEAYLFSDQERIGGCVRSFSRRDALKRHLGNKNIACIGRACLATEE